MNTDPTRSQKRDQQTNFMLTKDEKARFDAWRIRRGLSTSAACRYLVLMGLDHEEQGE
jgi:hypothetical protein